MKSWRSLRTTVKLVIVKHWQKLNHSETFTCLTLHFMHLNLFGGHDLIRASCAYRFYILRIVLTSTTCFFLSREWHGNKRKCLSCCLKISRVFLVDVGIRNFIGVLQDLWKFDPHIRVSWSLHQDLFRICHKENLDSNSLINTFKACFPQKLLIIFL